jgi:hypothetical protein
MMKRLALSALTTVALLACGSNGNDGGERVDRQASALPSPLTRIPTSWFDIGGVATSDVTACQPVNGNAVVLTRGLDGQLWQDMYDVDYFGPNVDGWSGWAALPRLPRGLHAASAATCIPSVTRTAPDGSFARDLVVYALDENGSVWRNVVVQDVLNAKRGTAPTWGAWESEVGPGTHATYDPSHSPRAGRAFDRDGATLVLVGGDGNVHKLFDASPVGGFALTNDASVGAFLTGESPGVAIWLDPARLVPGVDVKDWTAFAVGRDRELHQLRRDGVWTSRFDRGDLFGGVYAESFKPIGYGLVWPPDARSCPQLDCSGGQRVVSRQDGGNVVMFNGDTNAWYDLGGVGTSDPAILHFFGRSPNEDGYRAWVLVRGLNGHAWLTEANVGQ